MFHAASKSHSVLTSVLLLAALVLHAGNVAAERVGNIVNLSTSGQLLAEKANRSVKVLTQGSEIDNGDVLESQKNTYAQIKFLDDSEITLGPNTRFKIDNFSYIKDDPKEDHAIFSLIKGILRSITGELGHRSSGRSQLSTPTATIGIRGTNYIAQYNPEAKAIRAPATNAPEAALPTIQHYPSGLVVKVVEGAIQVTNDSGTLHLVAGQSGYAPLQQELPVFLQENPDILFNPSFGKSAIQCSVN